MMKTNLRWQVDPNSQPPPRRKDLDGKPKQYIGIARIGLNPTTQSEGDKPAFKPKNQFNVDEGRDYTLDAPVKQDDDDDDDAPKDTKKSEEIVIPVVKSPAQVAAEKAAEWKRQQLEAEAAKKHKTYIRKKQDSMLEADAPKTIQFSALEREL